MGQETGEELRRGVTAPLLFASLLAVAAAGVRAPAAAPLAIPLTVEEPSGVPRVHELVTSGVPVPPAEASGPWALFDGERELPVQVTPLGGRRPAWLLLDFPLDVEANGVRRLTLRQGASRATAPDTLVIRDDASGASVATGRLRVTLSRDGFDPFHEVARMGHDSARTSPPAGARFEVIDAATDTLLTPAGPPDHWEWEARGPLRATLRVDGTLREGGAPFLGWTARLTFRAGSARVGVELVLRNSFATRETYRKVRSASLSLGAGGALVVASGSGAHVEAGADPGGVRFELVPARMTVTTAIGSPGKRTNAEVDVGQNDGFPVADLSYFGATVELDFDAPRPPESGALGPRATAAPLFAVAAPAWYSEQGAFGSDRFGTLDDELETYRRWGWSWSVEGRPWSRPPQLAPLPDFAPSWTRVDARADPEQDDLWQSALMVGRTGQRGWLDRAAGWARWAKWEYSYRTDGFRYAWDDWWEGPARAVKRTPIDRPRAPAWTLADSLFVANDVKRGKASGDHLWAGGLVDWYFLTGDRDALAAAIDLGEIGERLYGWRAPGAPSSTLGGERALGRHLMNACRLWEATGEPRWRTLADHLAQMELRSANWDPRGFYAHPDPRHPRERVIIPFFAGVTAQALYRYDGDFGAPAARDRLVRMARFLAPHALDDSARYTGDYLVVDAPKPGVVRHLSYDAYRGTANRHVPWFDAQSTVSLVDVFTIGWRLTEERAFLDRAKELWDRASHRFYEDPYDRVLGGPGEVGRFSNSLEGGSPGALFLPSGGDATYTALFFHDAARAAWEQ